MKARAVYSAASRFATVGQRLERGNECDGNGLQGLEVPGNGRAPSGRGSWPGGESAEGLRETGRRARQEPRSGAFPGGSLGTINTHYKKVRGRETRAQRLEGEGEEGGAQQGWHPFWVREGGFVISPPGVFGSRCSPRPPANGCDPFRVRGFGVLTRISHSADRFRSDSASAGRSSSGLARG
jgi:hypothetical protein